MSVTDGRAPLMAARWRGLRLVIAAAALVFAGLALAGTLAAAYALVGFAIMAAAAALALRSGTPDDRLARPVAISERGDDFLKALVAGLPDPVVALDRDGRVLTLNERARAIAPALRQGEPVSFALRMPELIEAIGHAAQGEERRVVYSERVPVDRWFRDHRDAGQARSECGPTRFRADDFSRSHSVAPGRRNARGLRRQCQPRAAHAARRAVGFHRKPCRARRARIPRRASASSRSCRSRRGGWRG